MKRSPLDPAAGRPAAVRIPRSVLDAVAAHAQAAKPAECCGLLIGAGHAIHEAVPARNLADSPTRFLLDPRDHIDALRRARRRGLDVVAFYHSHPASAAWPSPTDVEEAAYAEALHLIVSLATEPVDARLFRIDRDGVTEVRVMIEGDKSG